MAPTRHGVQFALVQVVASSTIVAAAPGKRIVVVGYAAVAGTATTTIQWQSAGSNLTGVMGPFGAGSGVATEGSPDSPLFQTGVGEPLILTLTGTGPVAGHCAYYLSPT